MLLPNKPSQMSQSPLAVRKPAHTCVKYPRGRSGTDQFLFEVIPCVTSRFGSRLGPCSSLLLFPLQTMDNMYLDHNRHIFSPQNSYGAFIRLATSASPRLSTGSMMRSTNITVTAGCPDMGRRPGGLPGSRSHLAYYGFHLPLTLAPKVFTACSVCRLTVMG